MPVEKAVDNVEKCESIIVFSFFPQGIPRTKPAYKRCITGEILVTYIGYVAAFLWCVSQPFLAKKLTNPPNKVK